MYSDTTISEYAARAGQARTLQSGAGVGALTLALGLLFGGCAAPPGEHEMEQSPVVRFSGAALDTRATARIRGHGGIECGAFAVDARLLLTAAHCLRHVGVPNFVPIPEDAPVVESVTFQFSHDGPKGTARVLHIERATDYAALELDSDAPSTLPVRPAMLGETAISLRTVNIGILTGTILDVDDFGGSTSDLPTIPGDSGSPVLGTDGAAFGIVSARWGNDLAYAAPAL
ncbi:MAG TPA: serine protease [Polyangiaceae bacterium]|nr:serine protease [Polyangiaceae bacterium]